MTKRIISIIPLAFIVLCLLLFVLPAVEQTNFYESASGYQTMFGTVQVKQYGTFYPERIGFMGVLSVIMYFISAILIVVSVVMSFSNKDSWVVPFLLGCIALFIFSFSYIFIAESLPKGAWNYSYGAVHYEKPKFGSGSILTGILGIIVSIVSGILWYTKKDAD